MPFDRRDVIKAALGLAGAGLATPALAQPRPESRSESRSESRPGPIGTIEEVRGEGYAESNGERRKLAARGDVFVGDLLSTGSNALIVMKLGAATTIKLGADSRLKVDRYLAATGGEFDIQAGHMMFERTGKPATQGITFKSVYGLLAVRGTRFYAGPNRGRFALLVGEGRVEVTAGGSTVMVRPQEGVDIHSPGAQPTTPASWKLPRIREMQANFR